MPNGAVIYFVPAPLGYRYSQIVDISYIPPDFDYDPYRGTAWRCKSCHLKIRDEIKEIVPAMKYKNVAFIAPPSGGPDCHKPKQGKFTLSSGHEITLELIRPADRPSFLDLSAFPQIIRPVSRRRRLWGWFKKHVLRRHECERKYFLSYNCGEADDPQNEV